MDRIGAFVRGVRANWWLLLAVAGFLGYVEPLPSWLRLLNLLFLWPLLRPLARTLSRRASGEEAEEGAAAVPEPPFAGGGWQGNPLGPARRLDRPAVRLAPGPRGSGPAVCRGSARRLQGVGGGFFLPAEGTLFVALPCERGGRLVRLQRGNRRADEPLMGRGRPALRLRFRRGRRRALRRWREGTEGRNLGNYLCYAEPILAPADGVVAAVEDGIRDAPRPGTGWLDPFAGHIAGNHVVIEHAEGEYSFLAHLVPGSITVGVGEWVSRGQQIGRCGSSGNSSEPHLHFQVQDRADFFEAAGLPVAFDGVSVDGGDPESGVYLGCGMRVRPAGTATGSTRA